MQYESNLGGGIVAKVKTVKLTRGKEGKEIMVTGVPGHPYIRIWQEAGYKIALYDGHNHGPQYFDTLTKAYNHCKILAAPAVERDI